MPYIGNPIYQSAFVTDQFSGNGSTTAFTMSVSPAGTTNVLVVVSGVVQDPSTYGVVGNTLNFSTAPPSGTGNISCRYLGVPVTGVTTTAYRTVTEFTATAGQTTFTPPSYTVGYLNVYRNGVLLGSADYTASNGTTVVLATGATVGDLITTESFYVSSVLNAVQQYNGSSTNQSLTTPSVIGNSIIATSSTPGGTANSQIINNSSTGYGQLNFVNDTGQNAWVFQNGSAQNGYGGASSINIGGSGTTPVAIAQGTNVRLLVNTSGYVTKPAQPAFSVNISGSQSLGSGVSIIPWSVKSFDIANNFNTSTYIFTAPIAGRYFFTWQGYYGGLTSYPSTYFGFQPYYNGGSVFYGFNNGYSDTTCWGSIIYNMAAGDTFQVRSYCAQNVTMSSAGSVFCGYLLG